MINVTKTYLPPFDEYTNVLKRAWDNAWITNNGELVKELEQKLKEYLKVKHLFFTTNGTIVLQMALKALDISKEVITTPFSYVATTNAILWEGCVPVFVDIDPSTFCIDPDKIEAAITENTQAILATHVYGIPCNVEKIQKIAEIYNLRVIYDGAHAFGTSFNNSSLLSYGDISTCSFHATKLFHTVEGSCIICHDDELAKKIMLFRQFGHINDDYYSVGINGKNSEFHAAMGLSVFPYLPVIIEERMNLVQKYRKGLSGLVSFIETSIKGLSWNYSYFPIILNSEDALVKTKKELEKHNIFTRRYFYPSLNTIPYINGNKCFNSEELSARVLCLPLYPGLEEEWQNMIINIIKDSQ